MGLLDGKTSCHECGREIDKKSAEKRFGKFFCNEKEAEEFASRAGKQRAEIPRQSSSGGCC